MSNDAFDFDDRKLQKLMSVFSKGMPTIHLGVLGGEKNNRSEEGAPTNAEIGAKHEFGEEGLPVRSFLRMPLTEKLGAALEEAGAFDAHSLNEIIKLKTFVPFMEKVAILAEGIVLDAFDTGGFGKWKPSYMKLKKTKQTLVETQQLRNAITSKLVEETKTS